MIRSFRILAGLIAIVLVALVVMSRQPAKPPELLRLPEPAPDASAHDEGLNFTAANLAGGKIDFSKYRGHPVIVDFWATWCAPCRRQIPELVELYKKYGKTRGLIVLGISCDTIQGEGRDVVKPFVQEFKINYPIALADEELVQSLGVEAIPTTFFVGPDGKIVSRIVGAGRRGEISDSTMMLLDGSKRRASPVPTGDSGGHVADL